MQPATVLIVEDERLIAESICYSLQQEGFRVLNAFDGAAGLALAQEERPDLILLDILLPGMNGLDLCRELRRTSDVPIIMLTARGEEIDRVVGLEIGADDYVVKPFSMRELVARVRARLRKPRAEPSSGPGILRSGDLELDVTRHTVTCAGRALHVGPIEFDLLRLLMEHRGEALSREVILDSVWGKEGFRDPRKVDVHVRWLRGKIEQDPGIPRRIVTLHGVGYKFVE